MTKVKTIKCPKCGKEDAIIHPVYGTLQGKRCRDEDRKKVGAIQTPPRFLTQTMTDRITEQQIKYEKDIIQPYAGDGKSPDPEFVKAYPQQAREYFSQEQLEKL